MKTSGTPCTLSLFVGIVFFCFTTLSWAGNFPLPSSDHALLGQVQYIEASAGETAVSIAHRYNLGLNAILTANRGISEHSYFPRNYDLTIASAFLLPPLPRQGIVINLPEMRLYYYPGNNTVLTYPVGIGRIGKTIPIENTRIARKTMNPVWVPPDDIRQYNIERGIDLPEEMPPGPDNPLGPYAIYLGIPTYLIHSTIFPESIGRRASFGCIRMNEADIQEFFPLVTSGTPVAIIDMPDKVAWNGNHLYLEAHPPLEESSYAGYDGIVQSISHTLPTHTATFINWQLVAYLSEQPDGVPHEVGITRINE